ncbi:MAG: cell wall hydrolase [Lachnospiraceae bacterium]|nr:cell wall hydrolase [Lachnospiraceae bacterium]
MISNKNIKRIICSILTVCLLLCSTDARRVNSKNIQDKREDLEDAQTDATAKSNTVVELFDEIQRLTEELYEISNLVEEANAEVEAYESQIEESEKVIKDIENELEDAKEQFAGILSLIYEDAPNAEAVTEYLEDDNLDDMLNREEYADAVGEYVQKKMEGLKVLKGDAEAKNKELLALKSSKEDELSEISAQQDELSSQLKSMTDAMLEAEKNAEDSEKFANKLEEEMNILEEKERQILEGNSGNDDYVGNIDFDVGGNGTDYYYEAKYSYTEEELTMLAGIIESEAGSVSYPGMIAVGSVVMNRVASPKFPNTIEGVICAPYQFAPVQGGRYGMILARGPAKSCYKAARDVLDGKRNVPNFYFKADWYAEEHGIKGINIGGNVFH